MSKSNEIKIKKEFVNINKHIPDKTLRQMYLKILFDYKIELYDENKNKIKTSEDISDSVIYIDFKLIELNLESIELNIEDDVFDLEGIQYIINKASKFALNYTGKNNVLKILNQQYIGNCRMVTIYSKRKNDLCVEFDENLVEFSHAESINLISNCFMIIESRNLETSYENLDLILLESQCSNLTLSLSFEEHKKNSAENPMVITERIIKQVERLEIKGFIHQKNMDEFHIKLGENSLREIIFDNFYVQKLLIYMDDLPLDIVKLQEIFVRNGNMQRLMNVIFVNSI